MNLAEDNMHESWKWVMKKVGRIHVWFFVCKGQNHAGLSNSCLEIQMCGKTILKVRKNSG